MRRYNQVGARADLLTYACHLRDQSVSWNKPEVRINETALYFLPAAKALMCPVSGKSAVSGCVCLKQLFWHNTKNLLPALQRSGQRHAPFCVLTKHYVCLNLGSSTRGAPGAIMARGRADSLLPSVSTFQIFLHSRAMAGSKVNRGRPGR